MAKKKNVTFDDIAKYTNFSKTTISRYFNDIDSLTLENQQIISDALVELNYKENKVARILANGKTEFIGIIIPDLYYHFYSEMLASILSTYEEFGYKFLVFIGNEKEETEFLMCMTELPQEQFIPQVMFRTEIGKTPDTPVCRNRFIVRAVNMNQDIAVMLCQKSRPACQYPAQSSDQKIWEASR